MADAPVVQLRPWKPEIGFDVRLRIVRQQYADRIGERLTQRQMAERVGIKPGTWAQWEAGLSTPRPLVPTVKRIAALTGVDPAWLLDVDQEPQPDPPDAAHGRRKLGGRDSNS